MAAVIGDIYQVQVLYDFGTMRLQNNFGFTCVTNVAGDAQAALASAFRTALVKNTSGGLLYGLVDDVSVTEIDVEDVKPGTLATYVSTAAAVLGTDAQDPLPPSVALVATLHTALKGRSYRGRFYHGVYSEAGQSGGVWAAGVLTSAGTIATQLLAVFGPAGSNGDWRLSVISRFTAGAERPTPIATQVTAISLDSAVRNQRRRQIGVGS